jgi:glycosyltransferase involved in cell wall biosynthesis
LFLHNSYYHNYYLARALRQRGWDALSVSLEDPGSAQSQFYHGEDLNLFHPDPRVFRTQLREFFHDAARRFRLVHFSGRGHMGLFPGNWIGRSGECVPWDFLELRRRGVKIAYTVSGCLDGVAQSEINEFTGGLCSKCVWQLHPEICSDSINSNWAEKLEALCSLIAVETDWALGMRAGRLAYREPLMMCLDPEIWKPDLEVPSEKLLPREHGELIVVHAVGNFDLRAQQGRNIKGTPAILQAIERLRAEGIKVRLEFASNVRSRDMRYLQIQSDVVIDQLNYGRYGAMAREAMMLGRPTICYIDKRQPSPLQPLRSLEECPLVSASEATIYSALKELLLSSEKRAAIGAAARAYAVKWHSADACAERYEGVYDRLMQGLTPAEVIP